MVESMPKNLGFRTIFAVVALALIAGLGLAQNYATNIAVDRGAAGMERSLRQLRTRASFMHVTAHPDDEDGGMLAYETRGQGARGILLTLNRGEGGQNEESMDMYDSLGLLRTQELLLADRYYGVDQYWTRAIDYGFSKTREEALEKWNHDRVLSDAVRVVRMTRPLIITSVFVGAATDGHGNHQVAGQIAQEAYVAAGDPNKFPEQIEEGLRPWTPLKVYARAPNFQITKEGMYDYAIDKYVPVKFFDYVNEKWSEVRPPVNVTIASGLLDPASGLTFGQIAREGWGFQKSQNGGGTLPAASPQSSAYHRYGSHVETVDREKSFFDGVDVSLSGIAGLAKGDTAFLKDALLGITNVAEKAASDYSAARPAAIAPVLADGLKATRSLMEQVRVSQMAEPGKSDVLFELGVKEKQFQAALTASLGIAFQTSVAGERPAGRGGAAAPGGVPARGPRGGGPTFTIAIPGQAFSVEAGVFNQSAEALTVDSVNVIASDGKNWKIQAAGEPQRQVDAGKDVRWGFAVTAPMDADLTRPYYARPDEEQPYYDLVDARYRNLSLAPYPLSMIARLTYHGVPFEIQQEVQTSERVPGVGNLSAPLMMGPAISVTVAPAAGAVPTSTKTFAFSCTVHSNVKGPAQGILRLKLPAGWRSTPAEAPFSMERDGEDHTITFSVSPDAVKTADYTITAEAEYRGKRYTEGYKLVGYKGLRPYPFYRPATYKAVGVQVKTADGLHIGFLPGTGDDVPKALENLGQDVRVLGTTDLTQGDLSGFDAIILGVRAYAVRADLKTSNGRLLEYVKNGGVLIVQYNLQDFDHNYGPYPFTLGQSAQKVVDEGSTVLMLDPKNPSFGWPNEITAADFKGWVEERGHGFMKTWDPRYTALVETHDPEQDPQKGGLLLARYGKGFYVYDAFALYRQLPSGVPGAYRLLGNLISLGKNPAWK